MMKTLYKQTFYSFIYHINKTYNRIIVTGPRFTIKISNDPNKEDHTFPSQTTISNFTIKLCYKGEKINPCDKPSLKSLLILLLSNYT